MPGFVGKSIRKLQVLHRLNAAAHLLVSELLQFINCVDLFDILTLSPSHISVDTCVWHIILTRQYEV